jgi:hypothetical protein
VKRRVYFIRPIGMPQGPVKIGCSCWPDGRRQTLAAWAPYPLEIIAEIDGSLQIERRFHAKFADQHSHREWFTWSPELQTVIDSVAAGTFDIETLPPPKCVTKGAGKSMDFCTPGWRYQRSVHARIQNLRARGLSWKETEGHNIYGLDLDRAGPATLEKAKAYIEPLIAAWTERFPPKSRRPFRAAA